MESHITLGDITIDVTLKDIKNVHLSVYPPSGRVRISAPLSMGLDTIRVYAISKLGWIKQQQRKLRGQERETEREYLDRESHYVWGKRYLLKVIEDSGAPNVELNHSKIHLRVPPGAETGKKKAIMAQWYRDQLKKTAPAFISKWETVIGVKVERLFVQQMKTKWGSCNPAARSIRLNTDLAKKPVECLEYIIVHEMLHLLEPTHSSRFVSLMVQFMPKWQFLREQLNQLPVSHVDWVY